MNRYSFIGDYILATHFAKDIGAERKFFNHLSNYPNRYFIFRRIGSFLYVKPCKEIMDLIEKGYLVKALTNNDDESAYDKVINITPRKKLGFWR